MKKLLSILIVTCMVCVMTNVVPVFAETTSGTCGENVTWTLDDDGTLTISGEGDMFSHTGYDRINSSKVKTVIIEDGVTSIALEFFERCNNLTNIIIPDSVTAIDSVAFRGCSSLTNITIPDSVTEIGNGAFESCSNLTNIEIPKNVTRICDYTFRGCSSLTNITIPDSVTVIGDGAFEDCTSLKSIVIPKNVTTIGSGILTGCSSLDEISVDLQNDTFSSINGNLYNKEQTEFIQYAPGKQDESFKLPDSVNIIGGGSFAEITALTSIMIPDSVTEIGYRAFGNCKNIKNITLPSNLTTIGYDAFYGCSSITSITIPNNIAYINSDAFYGCGKLEHIEMPDKSNIHIGSSAFGGTAYDENKSNWDNGLLYVGTSLVSACSNSDNMYGIDPMPSNEIDFIRPTTKNIAASIFEYNDKLKSIIIPDGVEVIYGGTFRSCMNLENVKLPENLKEIYGSAFIGCDKLKNIDLPKGVMYVGDWFPLGSELKKIHFTKFLKEIGYRAFSSLTDIYYDGTKADWENISIDEKAILTSVKMHYGTAENDIMLNGIGSYKDNIVVTASLNDCKITVNVDTSNNITVNDLNVYSVDYDGNGVMKSIEKLSGEVTADGLKYQTNLESFRQNILIWDKDMKPIIQKINWDLF